MQKNEFTLFDWFLLCDNKYIIVREWLLDAVTSPSFLPPPLLVGLRDLSAVPRPSRCATSGSGSSRIPTSGPAPSAASRAGWSSISARTTVRGSICNYPTCKFDKYLGDKLNKIYKLDKFYRTCTDINSAPEAKATSEFASNSFLTKWNKISRSETFLFRLRIWKEILVWFSLLNLFNCAGSSINDVIHNRL